MKKEPKKYSTFANTLFALKMYFKISPAFTIYKILNAVIGEIITTFEHTFLLAYIIYCVENDKTLTDVLYFLIPVAVAVTIKVVQIPIVNSYISPKFTAKFKKSVHLTLYKKAVGMEISKYDNTEFYNDFVWAMQQAPSHITETVNTFCALLSKIAVAVVTGSYIISADSVALVAALVIVPLGVFVYRAVNKLYIKREEEVLPLRRKRDYVNRTFYLVDFVKDMKLGRMSEKLEKNFSETTKILETPVKKYGRKISSLYGLNTIVSTVIWDGCFLTYLFYGALVLGKYGLSGLMAIYNSGDRLIGNLRRITQIYPDFQKHSLYIDKLRMFLDTENEMADEGMQQLPSVGDIEFKNVKFTYPGNDHSTINDVSLKIKKGEKIALVGFNGAGKSTLIKLLLRLYDPTEGEIYYGDGSIDEYKISDYRKKFGVLFQDFEIIATDIAGNISMGQGDFCEKRAAEALKKVAFWDRFKTLKNGYKTELTKEFSDDGINLSGGEAQKIALARVLYADADNIILDEPSSALDPIAEYQLNKAVTELAGDKTVIIISHRLSTTRFVDKIYMLEKGKIIESGNHEQLLSLKGKYADMFEKQAEKYRL